MFQDYTIQVSSYCLCRADENVLVKLGQSEGAGVVVQWLVRHVQAHNVGYLHGFQYFLGPVRTGVRVSLEKKLSTELSRQAGDTGPILAWC